MRQRNEELWGRNNEIDLITTALMLHNTQEPTAYFITGPSGVGKTKLCSYVRFNILPKIQSNVLHIHLDIHNNMTEHDTVRLLYDIFRRKYYDYGFIFPQYEIACMYLYRLQPIANVAYKIDNPSSFIQEITDALLNFSQSLVDLFKSPLEGLFVNLISSFAKKKAVEELSTARFHRLMKEYELFVNKLNEFSVEEIKSHLIDFWIDDLNNFMLALNQDEEDISFNHYIVFTLDSFEKRTEKKYNNWFTQKLISHIKYSIWFIFSTEVVPPTVAIPIQLKPFDTNNSALIRYLEEQGVYTAEDQNYILNFSDGLPAAIAILIRIYKENHNTFPNNTIKSGYTDLFKFYFSKHLLQKDKRILTYLSFFPEWNYSIFKFYAEKIQISEPEVVFNKLIQNTALIEQLDNGCYDEDTYCLIGIVEKTFRSILFEICDDAEIKAFHECRFLYYKHESEQLIKYFRENRGEDITAVSYQKILYNIRSAFDAAVR